MKKHIFITVLLILFVLVNGCDRQLKVQPSGKKIKVGIIGPFSATHKLKGEEGLKGIKTALSMYPYLNNGDVVELVLADDQNEPEQTVKALEKLTEVDKVAVIIALSTSASVLAVNAIADDHKTPVLALLATHQDITKSTSYVSQLCFDNVFQGMVAALYVMDELLIDRVAVFRNSNSFYSTSLADEFVRKYESLGGKITDIISVNPGTDVTETILDVIRENGAKLLYLPIQEKKVIEILTTLEEMDWNPKRMGSDGLLSAVQKQYQEELKHLEGLLAIDLYADNDPHTSFGKQAIKTYGKLYKSRGSTYAAAGVEGMAIVLQAMNRCADTGDSECINSMIRNTTDFEGLMGLITIQSNGKAVRPLIVNAIKNGSMKFVVKVY